MLDWSPGSWTHPTELPFAHVSERMCPQPSGAYLNYGKAVRINRRWEMEPSSPRTSTSRPDSFFVCIQTSLGVWMQTKKESCCSHVILSVSHWLGYASVLKGPQAKLISKMSQVRWRSEQWNEAGFFSNWHSLSDQKPSHWPVLPKTSWSVIKIRWNINTVNWKQTWSSRRQSWMTALDMCRNKLRCRCDSNSRQHWRQRRGEIWAQTVTGLLGQLPCLFTGQEQNLPVKNRSYLSSRNPVKTEMFTSQSQCDKPEITTLTFLSLKTLVTTIIILTVTLRRWN